MRTSQLSGANCATYMRKIKAKIIEDEIYRAPLSVFVGKLSEFQKLLKVNGFPEDKIPDNKADGYYIHHDGIRTIYMREWSSATLLHELIHHSFSVMDDRGIPIRLENDETITYYTEMMYKKIMKAYHKKYD